MYHINIISLLIYKNHVPNYQAVSWPTVKTSEGSNNSHAIYGWIFHDEPSIFCPTPLKNDGVRQLGWWHSQYMESHKNHVPNHHPFFGGITIYGNPPHGRCIVPLATSSKLAHWTILNSPYQAEHQRNWYDVEQRFDTTAMVWLPCPIWSEHRLQIGVSVHSQ